MCACDGHVYGNECEAAAAGFDLNQLGGCPPPSGQFNCGYRFCTRGVQYCQKTVGGAFGSAASYTCMPLPSGCGPSATCSCLSGVTCGSQCTEAAPGELTVTCYAP